MNRDDSNVIEKPLLLKEKDEIHCLTVKYGTSFFPYFIIIANSAWLLFLPELSYSYYEYAKWELIALIVCSTLLFVLFAMGFDRQAVIAKISKDGIELVDTSKITLFAWGVSRKQRRYKWSDIVTWRIGEIPPAQIYKNVWRSKGAGLIVTAFHNGATETFKIGGNLTLLNGKSLSPARFIALVYPLLPDNSVQFADNTLALEERMRSESWKKLNYSYSLAVAVLPILISLLVYQITYILVGFAFAIFLVAIYVQIKGQKQEVQKIIDNWKMNPENLQAIERIEYKNTPLQTFELQLLENYYKKLSMRYTSSRKTEIFGKLFGELMQYRGVIRLGPVDSEKLQSHLQERYTKLLTVTPL